LKTFNLIVEGFFVPKYFENNYSFNKY